MTFPQKNASVAVALFVLALGAAALTGCPDNGKKGASPSGSSSATTTTTPAPSASAKAGSGW